MDGGQKADKSSAAGKTHNGLKIASAKTRQNQENDLIWRRVLSSVHSGEICVRHALVSRVPVCLI